MSARIRSSSQKDIFVGREPELAQLANLIDRAKAGKGQLVAVSGEPGIGKTSLAREAALLAARKGFLVLWGRCHEAQYVPPYWPWKQILRGLSEESAPVTESPPGLAPEKARLQILDAAAALVRSASEKGPLFLVLDNLHCADGPSLELLELIVREMVDWRVLITVAYRETSLSAAGLHLSSLAGEGLFTRISLAGWDESSVRRYLREYAGSEPSLDLGAGHLSTYRGQPAVRGRSDQAAGEREAAWS